MYNCLFNQLWIEKLYDNFRMVMESPLFRIDLFYPADPGIKWNVSFAHFAHPKLKTGEIGRSFRNCENPFLFLAPALTSSFLVTSFILNYVSLLIQLVSEKEISVVQALKNTGLKESSYWSAWMIFETLLSMGTTFVILEIAAILEVSPFEHNSSFLVAMVLFTTQLSLTSIGFLISGFLNKTDSSFTIGFRTIVIAWIMMICVQNGFPYTIPYSAHSRILFSLFPWTLMTKAFQDFYKASGNIRLECGYLYLSLVFSQSGISWSRRDQYCVNDVRDLISLGREYVQTNCVMSVGTILRLLFVQSLGYFVIAIYISNIVPDAFGASKPFYYIFDLRYWMPIKIKVEFYALGR